MTLGMAAAWHVASAQNVSYQEDFQNRPGPVPIVRINDYAGTTGVTYSADPAWRSNCNGWVASWNQPATGAAGAATQIADCGTQVAWNRTQQLAQALGLLNGQTAAQARGNFAISAFTSANPGPGWVEIETAQIAFTGIPAGGGGRFVSVGVDVAALSCPPAGASPKLQFYLVSNSNVQTAVGGLIDACTLPSEFMAEARGTAIARAVRAGRYTASASVLYSGGATAGVRMRNTEGSGVGNDHAFDNLSVIDVTPQVTKSFASPVLAGLPLRLTLTITNTPDGMQKQGWALTDNLAAGLQVAAVPNIASTCTGSIVAAAPGATRFSVNGNLPAGPGCSISLDLFAGNAGSYANGPADMTPSTAINLPDSPAVAEVVTNRIVLRKMTLGGVGSFVIAGNNGMLPQTLTTSVSGTPVDGLQQVMSGTSGSTDTVILEILPANWRLVNATCTGLAPGTTVAFTPGGTMTIPFAGLAAQSGGRDVVCTLENRMDADLSISKQNADPTGGRVMQGTTTRYTLRVRNEGPGTVDQPSVRDVPSAGLVCAPSSPVACTGPAGACPAGAATVADLTGASGLPLGTLVAGATVDLSFDCSVP